MRLVQQDPHQFGDGNGGVCVVQLNGGFLRKVSQSPFVRRNRRTRSASEQATRKYSCTNRSACPRVVESSG